MSYYQRELWLQDDIHNTGHVYCTDPAPTEENFEDTVYCCAQGFVEEFRIEDKPFPKHVLLEAHTSPFWGSGLYEQDEGAVYALSKPMEDDLHECTEILGIEGPVGTHVFAPFHVRLTILEEGKE